MPDSEAKKNWYKLHSSSFSIKFMHRTEADMIDYMNAQLKNGIPKCTLLKIALREYAKNHPVEGGK